MSDWLLVLDEGTTSTRAILYDRTGTVGGVAQRPLTQHYPRPGWVEHDAAEIWRETRACAAELVAQVGADRIAAIGITNQRETVVAWDAATGEPLAPAIVWQDRRTADACAALRDAGHEDAVQATTGLVLDPYFSASKMAWLIANDPAVAAAGDRLRLGTVDAWLAFKLTGRAVTDVANASRTSLFALDGAGWDTGLAALFDVPLAALPEVAGNAEMIGDTTLFGLPIPVTGMAGDQQAATIGQGCLSPGETKATFGTGAFVLTNLGPVRPASRHRLLGTVLAEVAGMRHYALEGSVFVAGSLVQWLRDDLGLIDAAAQTEALARSVPDSAGVAILPALAGLGAPHWRPQATGVVSGLTFAATKAHLARAALEAISHQLHDLARAFAADGARWQGLRVDGGMSANDWLAQDLANVLDLPVERPADVETTARGAAMLAGVGCGWFADLAAAAAAMASPRRRFDPAPDTAAIAARLARWQALLDSRL